MIPAHLNIPVAYIKECFSVDEAGVLYWKLRPDHHFDFAYRPVAGMHKVVSAKRAGKVAGRVNSNGYVAVSIGRNGKIRKVLGHRIVWVLTYGEWPDGILDHINRNKQDNRPANLRIVTHAENMRNTERFAQRGFGGSMGVYKTASGRFRAQLTRHPQRHLGTFDTEEQAREAFLRASNALTTGA